MPNSTFLFSERGCTAWRFAFKYELKLLDQNIAEQPSDRSHLSFDLHMLSIKLSTILRFNNKACIPWWHHNFSPREGKLIKNYTFSSLPSFFSLVLAALTILIMCLASHLQCLLKIWSSQLSINIDCDSDIKSAISRPERSSLPCELLQEDYRWPCLYSLLPAFG